jgi:hypothetical protein
MLVPEYFGRIRQQKNEQGDGDNHSIVMAIHFVVLRREVLTTTPSGRPGPQVWVARKLLC